MSTDPVLARARAMWEGLAAVPVSFPAPSGVRVVVSPESRMCPPGWAGIVVLDGQAIITAPSVAAAQLIEAAVAELPVAQLVEPKALGSVLPVAATLGPAVLAYLGATDFCPVSPGSPDIERLPADHSDLNVLETLAGDQDTAESGLREVTSVVAAVRDGEMLVAAAGYRIWPGDTAHLGVLTAPKSRGRGLARVTGSAAVTEALEAGLLPQWRARSPESRGVARALGFRELGAQLSVKLD